MTARLSLALLLLAAVGGCDRAAVEPLLPSLTIESPDLGAVLTQAKLDLRVRAGGSGQVVTVRIAGQDAQRNGDAFTASLGLDRGLTAIPLEGLDAGGEIVVRDTAYAFFARPETRTAPTPPAFTGGGALTATTLRDGRIVVAGGEPPAGAARADATVIRPVGESIDVVGRVALQAARYNHTATLLPDDSVVLLGGASLRVPRTRGDFVTTAEVVFPNRTESQNVIVLGTLPLRSGHVTRLVEVDGAWILFLIGGVVPGEPPTTTPTLDVLRYEPSGTPRLVVLSPPGGAGTLPEVPDPVLLDFSAAPDGNAVSFLYGLGPADAVSTRLTWAPPGPTAYPVGVTASGARALLAVGRTRAAGAGLSGAGMPESLFLVSGGRDDDGTTLGSIEAVAPAAGRAFAFDAAGALRRARSGHAATSFGLGRMLTLGGYNEAGFPILDPEITTL